MTTETSEPSKGIPTARYAVALAVVAALGIGTGALVLPSSSSASGPVTVRVPGAISVAVHCGGNTVHGDGEEISFTPADPLCDIEAPLTPVMPLRGQLQVGSARAYSCARKGMDLDCSPE